MDYNNKSQVMRQDGANSIFSAEEAGRNGVLKKYSDIINISTPVKKNRPDMPVEDRAAQFAPFAALAGYEDAIRHAELVNLQKMLNDNK